MPSRRIEDLHPTVAKLARRLIAEALSRGIELRVTSTLRSWAEQEALYAQGRTAPGKRVTDARPGQSLHNFGLAFDVAPFVNGKPDWVSRRWDEIGMLGKGLGLHWGGDWLNPDRPHFQLTSGLTSAEVKRRYLAGLDVLTGQPPAKVA